MRAAQTEADIMSIDIRLSVDDKTLEYTAKKKRATDQAFGDMAVDVERLSKRKVPVKTGGLRASGHHKRIQPSEYLIRYNKVYAAYQERGARRDGSRVVRRYTTAGTGKGYLSDALSKTWGKRNQYIKRRWELNRVR